MLGLRLPTQTRVNPGNLGSIDSAAALSFFDASQLAISTLQARAAHTADNQIPHASLQEQMSKPTLKRKRSARDSIPSIEKTSEEAQSAPQVHLSADYSPEQKRTKLGYHRTSIACGHCRRRKIRCLIPADEESHRCSNCIRLKKECSFHPVDQSAPSSKSKQRAAKSRTTAQRSIALSPTSTVPPPKRGHSDSSVKYSKIPPANRQGNSGLQNRKILSPKIHRSTQGIEHFSDLYATQIDQSWLTPGFHPLSSLGDQPQQPQVDYASNVANTVWDSTVSPHSHTHHRSPSWHDLNQQTAMSSPQPHFTPPTQSFTFTRPAPRSASHPELRLSKDYIAEASPFLQQQITSEPSQLQYQQMLTNEPLIQATASEPVTLSLQATLPEATLLSYPAINIGESASPFAQQHQWAIFPAQQDNSERSGSFEDQQFHTQWY